MAQSVYERVAVLYSVRKLSIKATAEKVGLGVKETRRILEEVGIPIRIGARLPDTQLRERIKKLRMTQKNGRPMTYKAIGAKVGRSAQRVAQICTLLRESGELDDGY